jgi:hypothetical protein
MCLAYQSHLVLFCCSSFQTIHVENRPPLPYVFPIAKFCLLFHFLKCWMLFITFLKSPAKSLFCRMMLLKLSLMSRALKSGPVRFFLPFLERPDPDWFPKEEIAKRLDLNRKKPQKTGPNLLRNNLEGRHDIRNVTTKVLNH